VGEPTRGDDASGGPRTRARIVDAAAVAIAELGWGGVTTRAVASRAGVNNALVHYYFGTKDALLLEAVRLAVERGLAETFVVLATDAPLTDVLHALARWAAGIDGSTVEARVFAEAIAYATHDEQARPFVREVLDEFRTLLHDRVVAAQEVGSVVDVDPGGLTILLAALLDGLLLHRLVDDGLDLDAAVAVLDTVLDPGRRAPDRRRNE